MEREVDGKTIDSKVTDEDLGDYINPMYSRTIEISKEQYERLKDFGDNPQKYGFDAENWGMFSNSCVDFTWSALNAAGLHATMQLPFDKSVPLKRYDGEIRVPDNVRPVESIQAPFPDSTMNRETRHPRPEANIFQKFFLGHIDNGTLTPSIAAQASPMLGQCLDGVQKLDASLGRTPDAGSTRMACSLANLAHDNGLQRVDAVYLSQRHAGGDTITGERVFVQQGDPHDPGGRRAGMDTAQAIATPLDTSLARLQQQEHQASARRELDQSRQVPALRSAEGPVFG